MKRILLISGIYFPDIGGPATYIPKLASRLVQLNYEVKVVSLTDKQNVARLDEPWQRVFVSRDLSLLRRTIELVRIIRDSSRTCDYVFANGLFVETALATLISKKKVTAKIVGDPVWERAKNKKKINLSIEEFNFESMSIPDKALRIVFKIAFRSFAKITTPSDGLANIVSSWGLNNVSVIHNGTECMTNEVVKTEFDVVSISRLVNWKRVDDLIRACKIADLSLLVVGDGPEMETLKNLARNLQANVKFLGQVDKETSIACIRKSDIFALLSSYEGLSFSLIEAMMLKKKILVSNAAGNVEVIRDGIDGIVLEEFNPDNIARNLLKLSGDDTAGNNYKANSFARAKDRYCLEKQLDQMIKLILRN